MHRVGSAIVRARMNLNEPHRRHDDSGRVLNHYLRMADASSPAKTTAELFVAYGSLPKHRRSEMHRGVARWMTPFAEARPELWRSVGHHWERALGLTAEVEPMEGAVQVTFSTTFEIDGVEKPAAVATSIARFIE